MHPNTARAAQKYRFRPFRQRRHLLQVIEATNERLDRVQEERDHKSRTQMQLTKRVGDLEKAIRDEYAKAARAQLEDHGANRLRAQGACIASSNIAGNAGVILR